MGIKNLSFVDNNPPQADAEFLNSAKSEVNNFVTSTGLTPSTGDLNQLGKSVAEYSAGSDFFEDTGTTDAFVLSVVGSKQAPTQYVDGMRIRFRPANTNTGACTVNVAGIGSIDIKLRDGVSDPAAGEIASDKEVQLTYDNGSSVFRLEVGSSAADAALPTGSLIAFAGTTAPTDFLLCEGSAVSRTTYANLFATIGTTYGSGDGSTTFNVPDYRGRYMAGLDNMGGSSANRITDPSADSLGGTFGIESVTPTGTFTDSFSGTTGSTSLSTSQMPNHEHDVYGSGVQGSSGTFNRLSNTLGTNNSTDVTATDSIQSVGGGGSHSHSFSGSVSGSVDMNSQTNLPPTMVSAIIIKT